MPPLPARHALIRAKHARIRGFLGLSHRRKTQLIAAFLRPIFCRTGSCTLYGEKGGFWEGSIRGPGPAIRQICFSDGEFPGNPVPAGKNVPKMLHFYTLFWDLLHTLPDCQNTRESWRCKTLMYAFGRRISAHMGSGMREMKRRAVLGVGISAFP